MNHRDIIRPLVRGIYDLQQLRIQMGNRIVGNWKVKYGQGPGKSEDAMDKEGKKILADLRLSFRRVTDGIAGGDLPRVSKFVGDGVIDTYAELVLVRGYLEMEKQESSQFKYLEKVLDDVPVYSEYLSKVRGCGPAMSGVIVSEIDIHKAKYASSIWAYAGLDTGPDGKGRSRRKEHQVTVQYTDKSGKPAEKQSITFNPFLKTKLVGVLGPSFIKTGSAWAQTYYGYKARLENHPEHKEKTPKHRHNMAIRRMVKLFLVDLYVNWKTLEGLPVAAPYAEAKLGLVHGAPL